MSLPRKDNYHKTPPSLSAKLTCFFLWPKRVTSQVCSLYRSFRQRHVYSLRLQMLTKSFLFALTNRRGFHLSVICSWIAPHRTAWKSYTIYVRFWHLFLTGSNWQRSRWQKGFMCTKVLCGFDQAFVHRFTACETWNRRANVAVDETIDKTSQMVGLLIYCSLLSWKSRNTKSLVFPCLHPFAPISSNHVVTNDSFSQSIVLCLQSLSALICSK